MKTKLKLLSLNQSIEEEENIKKFIYNPLLLLYNNKYLNICNTVLPFSVGIEIECNRNITFDLNKFKSIPYLLDFSSSDNETRFRIPNGVKGLISLYLTLELLKTQCELNPDSGIHYHIDMTNNKEYLNTVTNHRNYILGELDSWGYKGTYNKREIGEGKSKWVNIRRDFKTLEFRIGEMSFDYNLILHRINHCSQIVYRIVKNNIITYNNDINVEDVKTYLKVPKNQKDSKLQILLKNLEKQQDNTSNNPTLDEINQIIKNRIKQ